MQFKLFILAALSAVALAAPEAEPGRRTKTPRTKILCASGLTPECCDTSVTGINVGLTCSAPRRVPGTVAKFRALCQASNTAANCCEVDVDGVIGTCTAV